MRPTYCWRRIRRHEKYFFYGSVSHNQETMARKKIIFILNNFAIGGTERFLLDLITEIKKHHDVEIISVLGQGPLLEEFRKVTASIHNVGLFNFYDKRSLPKKILWFFSSPITLVRIIILLLKVKPNIVVTSLWHADVLGGIGGYISGVKKRVLIQHDIKRFRYFKKYFKKLAFSLATDIVANSQVTREFLVYSGMTLPQKITVIKIGINTNNFLNPKAKLLDYPQTLGFIGRLEPVKGCYCFMEALKKLKETMHLSPKALIAGSGSLKNELENYKNRYNLDQVEFLGEVNNVPWFLSKIDILVVPSLEESFGLVVLEGLISQKIVIVSDIRAFREIIKNQDAGLWFEAGNSADLAKILSELLEKPEIFRKYQNVAITSAKVIASGYEIKDVARDYLNLMTKG